MGFGRAGRGELAGRVIIQTYYPEHYAIRHAANQDFDAFFAEELKFRERFSYPPFVILALISIKHTDLRYAHEQANLMRSALEKANNDTAGRIYGVAPASLDKLFDRFYREESSRNRATGGSGLGLAICRSIITALGGRIVAEPSPLGGLRIRIDMPLVTAQRQGE